MNTTDVRTVTSDLKQWGWQLQIAEAQQASEQIEVTDQISVIPSLLSNVEIVPRRVTE